MILGASSMTGGGGSNGGSTIPAIQQTRGGGSGAGGGGGLIPGQAFVLVPAGGDGDKGGVGGIPFFPTPVRLVDGTGAALPNVLVTIRDDFGEIVAARVTDHDGLAVFVSVGAGAVMLDAVSVGVAGVPFVPGTNILVVADD